MALLVVLVISPLAEGWPVVSSIFVSIVLLAGIFSIHNHPLLRKALIALVSIVLILRWIAHVYGEEHGNLVILAHLAIGIYMFLLAVICIRTVLRRQQITKDTIVGAVCGYLLIAYVFAFSYAVVEDIKPGSFDSSLFSRQYEQSAKIGHETPVLLYYSFVTLTTVGYGDIVPANPAARSLATFEMLAGQLYLAAFVARLVGAMGSGREQTDKKKVVTSES